MNCYVKPPKIRPSDRTWDIKIAGTTNLPGITCDIEIYRNDPVKTRVNRPHWLKDLLRDNGKQKWYLFGVPPVKDSMYFSDMLSDWDIGVCVVLMGVWCTVRVRYIFSVT